MVMNRREFLAGMTAVTAAALCGPGAVLAPDPCDHFKLDPDYRRAKGTGQLSMSFLGTFAIFVFKDRIEAYTPKIVDHNYWLAKPSTVDDLDSDYLFDLKSPNKFVGIDIKGPTPGPYPTFKTSSPGLSN